MGARIELQSNQVGKLWVGFLCRAVDKHNIADALHEFGLVGVANFFGNAFARIAISNAHSYFNQLVIFQCPLYLGVNVFGDTIPGNHNHWFQPMAHGLKLLLVCVIHWGLSKIEGRNFGPCAQSAAFYSKITGGAARQRIPNPPFPGTLCMARSKTSARWLKEHFDDHYVKLAQQQGFRSRASFKLIEIDDKHRLLKPGMTVIDLGAAPGGWSQVASKRIGSKGAIVAVDLLAMDSMADVEIIQGDFTEQAIFEQIMDALGGKKADLVFSDMAPNISGMADIDQPRAMYLIELALDLAQQALKPGGSLLVKAFHGEGFDDWLRECKLHFKKVQSIKPKASRPRSKEIYQLAQGFKKV